MGSHQQDKIVIVQKPYERMGERGKKQSDVSACSKEGRKNRNIAVVTVLAGWAIPDRVFGLELPAETAAVREWSRLGGAAGLGVIVMILRHGMPPYVAFTCVGNSCGQGDAPGLHGFRSVMVGDESGVVEIRVDV